jgi:hypothetical protein
MPASPVPLRIPLQQIPARSPVVSASAAAVGAPVPRTPAVRTLELQASAARAVVVCVRVAQILGRLLPMA